MWEDFSIWKWMYVFLFFQGLKLIHRFWHIICIHKLIVFTWRDLEKRFPIVKM